MSGRPHLRLALPPLASLNPDSLVAFAVLDARRQVLRSGELPLAQLAGALPRHGAYAILHTQDALVARVTIPDLPARRLPAAVAASVEPLLLSELDTVSIGHGDREADGQVTAAWADRAALARAWRLLAQAGLEVRAFVPHALAVPGGTEAADAPLALPADARWRAPLPAWSVADAALQPAGDLPDRWRRALAWLAAAALLWLAGLHVYAGRAQARVDALRDHMAQSVQQAFPQLPVVLDPLRQARQQRDALRLAQGVAAEDDFLPLALAAARVLGFARQHVARLDYTDGRLTLALRDDAAPPRDLAALRQAAAAQAIVVENDPKAPQVWTIRHAQAGTTGGRP